jgi:glycosyltransferase involved in cell wall biosynthesis
VIVYETGGGDLKPTVLQLIGSFHQGGSERQAVQLARLLKESGRYNLQMACLDSTGILRDEVEQLELGEIPEYRLTSFYDRNALVQVRRLALHLQTRRIDIVQTHDFYSNVFGMAAARLAGVKARIAARRETTGWRTRAQKIVERQAYRLAHSIVANSAAVAEQLVKEGVTARKIVTVYNGLDMARVALPVDFNRERALASFGLPREGHHRFVTIVANLRHEVKDHAMFLRAARQVRERVPTARFVIAGEGALLDSVRAMAAELSLAQVVFFTGRCGRVAELLAVSDVCVLSSKAEGFSNSILEYMAAARPVVVTDVGGAREAVADGESGYLVPAGADQMMAARIASLLGDPECASAMGERGQQIIARRFSCAAQLEHTENLYDQLLARDVSLLPQTLERVQRETI